MILFLYIGTVVLGMAGAVLVWRLGPVLGLCDEPSARSSHLKPTPRGGGVGIVAALILAASHLGIPLFLWLPFLFLAIICLLDDRIGLSPALRLVAQTGAALVLLPAWPLAGEVTTPAGFFAALVLLFFLLATSNFFNFMDGINGMAALAGAVGFGLLALFVVLCGKEPVLGQLSLCLAFACLGFLPFNCPQAKVFLGDVGSVLLGFTFAALSARLADSYLELMVLSGFLLPFYADTLVTLWLRWRRGENLFLAHRQHLYQILVRHGGYSHCQVSSWYAAIQLLVGLLILWQYRSGHQGAAGLIVPLLLIVFAGVSSQLRRVEKAQ